MALKRTVLYGALLMFAAFVGWLSFSSRVTARPTAICTWPNSTTGNWTDAGTWSCGNVPGPADDVNVGFGGVINLNTPATINNLTMLGGTISGTNALTVTGLMQFTGFAATLNTHGSRLPQTAIPAHQRCDRYRDRSGVNGRQFQRGDHQQPDRQQWLHGL